MRFLLRLSPEEPLAEIDSVDLAEATGLPDVARLLAQFGAGLEIVAFGEDAALATSWSVGGAHGWSILIPDDPDVSRPDIAPIDELEI